MEFGMRVALAQVETTSDPAVNRVKAGVYAREAAARGADLLVLPEMFMGLPVADCPPAEIVRRDGGAFLAALSDFAKEAGIHITAGCWELVPGQQRVYNTAVTVSPSGEQVAAYRKIHLFDALNVRESDTMLPGDALPPVVEIAGVRVGFAICYDLRFPELFRYLALQDAQLIVIPSAWYQGPVKETHWLTLLQARAIENTLYVAGGNLVGPSFCGRSAFFDPFGIQVAGAGEVETLLVGEIRPDRIGLIRDKLPALKNRRMSVAQTISVS
ncbi:MAG: carbon-nitrogen hydrolase family protein [Desulfosarcina sp.]